MKLRSIFISFFEWSSGTEVDARRLDYAARPVCHFVQRAVRKMAVPTEGFNAIIVRAARPGHLEPGPPALVPVKCLQAPFVPDFAALTAATGDALHRLFADVLRDGLHAAAMAAPLPLDAMLGRIDAFVDGGLVNEWLHRRRKIGSTGLKGELRCAMTAEAFRLRPALTRKGEDVWSREILETNPDELCFYYKFDDVTFDGDTIRVVDKHGGTLFESALAALPV